MARDEAPLADDRRTALLERYRRRFRALEEGGWERLFQRLGGGEAIREIGRDLGERRLCPDLSPSSVNVYLSQLGHHLGVPAPHAPGQEELGAESEDEQPIEAQDALKRLRWLSRIQQARVRKALALERSMGGLFMDRTSKEIKLLAKLLQIELKALLALGELKQAPEEASGARDGTAARVVDLQTNIRLLAAIRRQVRSHPQLEN